MLTKEELADAEAWANELVPDEVLVAQSRIVRMTPYGLQDGNGVDIGLIESILKFSPMDRARRASEAARSLMRLRNELRTKRATA